MSMGMPEFKHRFADRMDGCGVEGAFVVLAQAKQLEAQGKDIIHLQIGEPDFSTPSNIIKKAHWALDNGYTHYTPSAGFHQTRERYAEYVAKTYGRSDIGAENIVIMPGAKPVVFLSALALINPGDEVIHFNPSYPAYDAAVRLVGGVCKHLDLQEETGFRFEISALEKLITPKTKMFVLCSPQNPTGGILTKEDMAAVAKLAKQHGFYVLSDEIYNRFVYDGEHASFLHQPDVLEQTIVLDGHSKTYAMTGWRLGFAITSKAIAQQLTLLMTNSSSCPAAFTQVAGEEALLGDQSEAEAMIAEFKARRDLIVDGLNDIPGVSCTKPAGAFYVFPNIKHFTEGQGRTSLDIQHMMLNEFGVALLAGTSFGPGGEGYLRLSYANSRENLTKALERIKLAFSHLS